MTTDENKPEPKKIARRPYLSGTLKSPSGEVLGVVALWIVKSKKERDTND
jgi:hypothetical protein